MNSMLTRHRDASAQQGGADPVPSARVRDARKLVRLRSTNA